MLKINLLPSYIYEKRKVRQTALVFAVLFIGVVAGMVAWYVALGAKQREMTIQVADMQQIETAIRKDDSRRGHRAYSDR